MTFGALWLFFNADSIILDVSLPQRIAISKATQSVMIVSLAQLTAMGLALLTFYPQGKLETVDTILAIYGYVCWSMAGSASCTLL